MLLQTLTGQETFGETSAKAFIFHVPTTAIRGTGKELHLGVVAKAGIPGFSRVGPATTFPIAPGYLIELGMWTRATYDVPEGAVLKIYAQKALGFSQRRVMAAMLLRVRSTAALQRVSAILTGNTVASISRANFEGRFDILTVNEAMALGANIALSYLNTFSTQEVARAFEVQELEVAMSAPVRVTAKAVENAAGERVVVPTARRGRIIDVG